MITELSIVNYRCFPTLTVDLCPLTVLIGQNNTGKTVFLDAVRHLGHDLKFGWSDYWRLNSNANVKIRAKDSNKIDYQVNVAPGTDHIPDSSRSGTLPGVAFYRLPSGGIYCAHEGIPDSVKDLPFGNQGDSLAAVLDYLLRKERKRFDSIVTTLRNLIPGFEDLDLITPDAQTREFGAVLDNGVRLSGDELSVGVRNLIFFVTLAHHPKAPNVILLEEPEHGVHPKRLGDIVSLLRSISQGKYCDNPAQVILTTHSPFLLDYVDLEQDQVLIFQRDQDGARNAYPADRERLKVFLDEFMLGEVWFNESEKGLIGANSQ